MVSVPLLYMRSADPVFGSTGVDYAYRTAHNDMIEMEWMSGEMDMTEEEYVGQLFCPGELHLETGGRYFRPRLVGAGYHHEVGGVGAVIDVTAMPAAAAA